jgi:pyruvate,water dikinase
VTPRCVPLHEALERCGGKARGLGQLARAGFSVPPGFAIIDATADGLPPDLLDRARSLGPLVAVRSSAAAEDGDGKSYAGQLETLLDVSTSGPGLEEAVRQCLRSAGSDRVLAYAGAGAQAGMAVVVQAMVKPALAGVLFTIDPVSGRRDHLVIDAVRGLGERLVSGEATPEHLLLSRRQQAVLSRDLVEPEPLVSDALAQRLAVEALAIEAAFGKPLDLEWAIDGLGQVHWLQARPITTLGADPDELDTPPPGEGDVYTRSNIGEMMPGLVTPLSLSVSARGIDVGLQRMQVELGVLPAVSEQFLIVGAFSGQLFLNLTRLARIGTHVAGATVDRMCQAVCGRVIPELDAGPLASTASRAVRALRYGLYLLAAPWKPRRMVRRIAGLRFEAPTAPPRAQWDALDQARCVFYDVCDDHTVSSALSGAMAPAILEIVAGGQPVTDVHHARAAELMGDASGVESADIAAGAERLADVIAAAPGRERFVELSVEAAARWLAEEGPAEPRAAFAAYLARHGHRSVRELELRERSWAEDPTPLVAMLQAAVRARLGGLARVTSRPTAAALPFWWRPLVALAHLGVRTREASKSQLVRCGRAFRAAYLRLAEALLREGALPDVDAAFFLSHEELGLLARGEGAHLPALALARREAQAVQAATVFPPLFSGCPAAVRVGPVAADGALVLTGRPVSRGVAEGRACVVRSLSEARAIEPGDVLIAPITDVGWTPYFGAIAALVTDLGSAVSHGAVVARECGLPCVVNTGLGTSTFRTGDRVRVDGTRGTVELLERAGAGRQRG